MPYITREDGVHFVIPSYRDVLTTKQKSALRKEILSLSQNYGEFITMQRKGPSRYEVAFSPDTGYLLGESIWHYFKKPEDMIYCEAIPNSTEAILVIVKAGSVYLDGTFPIDSIPEELVVFLTEQNNFEINVYGEVPIGQTPDEGKFCFDSSSVKSFTKLDKPVFPTLPLVSNYQLLPVDQVLKANGIGVFPLRQTIGILVAVGLAWMLWSYMTEKPPEQVVVEKKPEVNPYQGYLDALTSPTPTEEIDGTLKEMALFFAMPGWTPKGFIYANGSVVSSVTSSGSSVATLIDWAKQNQLQLLIRQDGIYVSGDFTLTKRDIPKVIYSVRDILASILDRLREVYPGNHVQLGQFNNKGVYTEIELSISLDGVSPLVLNLIAKQLQGLPLVLRNITLTSDNGNLSGSMNFLVLGR